MRNALLIALTAVCVVVVSAATAVAQPPGAPPGAQRGLPQEGDASKLNPGEIQRMFDAYVIVEVQQLLGLNDELYVKFIVRLRNLQDVRRKHQQARNMVMNELRKLLGRPRAPVNIDEAQVKDRLKALQDLEIRFADELRKAYAGVDELLTVGQQARFRVFEEEMERRKLDLVSRARLPQRGRGQFE